MGSELGILLDSPIKEIESVAGERIAEGIKNMRKGKISINPGYDGEFGTIKLFPDWLLYLLKKGYSNLGMEPVV